jgi:hypothetical protein
VSDRFTRRAVGSELFVREPFKHPFKSRMRTRTVGSPFSSRLPLMLSSASRRKNPMSIHARGLPGVRPRGDKCGFLLRGIAHHIRG